MSPWVKLHLILILVVSDPELHPPPWDLPGGSSLLSQPSLNADAQPGLSLALPEAPESAGSGFSCVLGGADWSPELWPVVRGQVSQETLVASTSPSIEWN